MSTVAKDGRLRVVVVFPDLLGTYGDGGNGLVLVQRARWRGIDAELVQAVSDQPVPAGDIYCLGGGEDGPQVQAANALRRDATFLGALDAGAAVLAVCAGFQIIGRSFPDPDGRQLPGVGLLDIETAKVPRPRMVGEVVAEPAAAPEGPADLPALTGFENHGGATRLGAGARPWSTVTAGVGNGSGDGTEGAWSGRVVGSYLHGPILARNPAVADMLLGWALDHHGALGRLDDVEEEALRRERLADAARRRRALERYWRRLSGR